MSMIHEGVYVKPIPILIHIFVWLIFIQIVFDVPIIIEKIVLLLLNIKSKQLDEAFILLPLIIILFYLNSEWIIPKFFNKGTWWKFLFLLLATIIALSFIAFLTFHLLVDHGFSFDLEDFDIVNDLLFMSLLTSGFSCSYAFSKMAFHNIQLKNVEEKLRLEAELKYLKSQVHPHFLFNSLNTIYSLANEEDSPQTTEAVLKLSEMMRYMLHEATKSFVDLKNEIEFLQKFVELQLLRLGNNIHVDFKINGDIKTQKITPLLLIAFLENTFKHGVSYENPLPILIELNIESNRLTLITKNSINKRKYVDTSGVGLENAKKRLMHIYPTTHELIINQNENTFEVNLKIAI